MCLSDEPRVSSVHGSDSDSRLQITPRGHRGTYARPCGVLDRPLVLSASAPSLVVTVMHVLSPLGARGHLGGFTQVSAWKPPRPSLLSFLDLSLPALTIDCQPSNSLSCPLGGLWPDCRPSIQGPAGCLSPWGRQPPGAPCQPPTPVGPQAPDLQTEKRSVGWLPVTAARETTPGAVVRVHPPRGLCQSHA